MAPNSSGWVVKLHDNCATEVSIPPDAHPMPLDAEEVVMLDWITPSHTHDNNTVLR